MALPLPELPPLLGESPAFRAMLEQVSRLAPLARPTLVVGERGTGKELIAARLHYLSRRWERPLIKLNCAALSETLLESELFGHEVGAFTGAARRHVGRFELADGGSLFLDEIAAASPAVQEKILRVIEYGTFERVGGRETLVVDVRVIGATNADLPALAERGRFRADLLDRLAFDVVTVPPLRARQGDIPLLAQAFGVGMARDLERAYFAGFTAAAHAELARYGWPGNVRELKNVVERSVCRVINAQAAVDRIILDPFASPFRPGGLPGDEPEPPAAPDGAPPPASGAGMLPDGRFLDSVQAFEIALLSRALEDHRFNRRRAAEALGLGYHQLRGYLRKYGLAGR